jgi:hypothetical protein
MTFNITSQYNGTRCSVSFMLSVAGFNVMLSVVMLNGARLHDTQHTETQHNDTQHNGTQHNDTKY